MAKTGGLPFDNQDPIPTLNSLAEKNKHSYTSFSTDGQQRSFYCNPSFAARLNNLGVLATSVDANHDKITTILNKITADQGKNQNNRPPGVTPALLLSRDHIMAMHNELGDKLADEIRSVTSVFDDIKGLTPSMKLVYLYAHGVMFRDPVTVDVNDAGGPSEEVKEEVLHLVVEGLLDLFEGPVGVIVGTLLILSACKYFHLCAPFPPVSSLEQYPPFFYQIKSKNAISC